MSRLRRFRKLMADQRGYTLVELILAMAIFAMISVVIVGALVTVMQSSAKTAAERRVQQDARYSIEEIARQTRSAAVDYDFYRQNSGDPRCAFSPAGSNSTRALALVFTEASEISAPATERVVFFYDESDSSIYRYQNSIATQTPSCADVFAAPIDAATGPSKSKITANNVTVPTAMFFVSPNQDPYDESPCTTPACNIARDTHPRVTILLTTQAISTGVAVSEQSRTGTTTLQTTVGTRAYPTDVELERDLVNPPPTPTPAPTGPLAQMVNGNGFFSCAPTDATHPGLGYCRTNDPTHPNAVYSLSGGRGSHPDLVIRYRFTALPAGTYALALSYFNFQSHTYNPPAGYSYRITISYPGGSQVVNLPIESTDASQELHEFTVNGLNLPANPLITLTWDNDEVGAGPPIYDANFGLNSVKLTAE